MPTRDTGFTKTIQALATPEELHKLGEHFCLTQRQLNELLPDEIRRYLAIYRSRPQ